MTTPLRKKPNFLIAVIEGVVFNVKWLLTVFYCGLIVVMLLYGYSYLRDVIRLVEQAQSLATDEMQIIVLDFVDAVMLANLVKMIIAGSYNSFVSKAHGRPNENISSGTLKIKISTSIVVLCSIHLLRTLITAKSGWEECKAKVLIFIAFLAATLVLGILEYLHVKGMAIENSLAVGTDKHG